MGSCTLLLVAKCKLKGSQRSCWFSCGRLGCQWHDLCISSLSSDLCPCRKSDDRNEYVSAFWAPQFIQKACDCKLWRFRTGVGPFLLPCHWHSNLQQEDGSGRLEPQLTSSKHDLIYALQMKDRKTHLQRLLLYLLAFSHMLK